MTLPVPNAGPSGNRFSIDEKRIAKTLFTAYGSLSRTRKALEELWDVVPADITIRGWVADSRIEIDDAFMADFSRQVRLKTIGRADHLSELIADRIEKTVESGTAVDVKGLSISFGIMADKVTGQTGRFGAPMPGGMTINGPVQIVAWAPREAADVAPPAGAPDAIEGEFV